MFQKLLDTFKTHNQYIYQLKEASMRLDEINSPVVDHEQGRIYDPELSEDTFGNIALNKTDDIGDSIPYRMLVDSITNKTNDIDISYPFERFSKFDVVSSKHDFIINYRYADLVDFPDKMKQYTSLFDMAAMYEGLTDFTRYAILSDTVDYGEYITDTTKTALDLIKSLYTYTDPKTGRAKALITSEQRRKLELTVNGDGSDQNPNADQLKQMSKGLSILDAGHVTEEITDDTHSQTKASNNTDGKMIDALGKSVAGQKVTPPKITWSNAATDLYSSFHKRKETEKWTPGKTRAHGVNGINRIVVHGTGTGNGIKIFNNYAGLHKKRITSNPNFFESVKKEYTALGSSKAAKEAWRKADPVKARLWDYYNSIGFYHFHIDRNGVVHQLIDIDKHVYHAHEGSQSQHSVGIELQAVSGNMGTYTKAQYASLVKLIFGYIMPQTPNVVEIVSHRFCRIRFNNREYTCPGPQFAWKSLYEEAQKVYGSGKTFWAPGKGKTEIIGIGKPPAYEKYILNTANAASQAQLSEYNKLVIAATNKSIAVKKEIDGIIRIVLRNLRKDMIKKDTLDVRGKVTSFHIGWKPGTSVPIPMQGEPAPVIQSTGGRQVQATVQMTITDPMELAKMMIMFKTPDAVDSAISMLMVARNIYKAGEDNKNRFRFISSYTRSERIEKNVITASQQQGEKLPEPVTIKNTVLNSLGLSTFIPYSIEIQTQQGTPGAYTVALALTYINTSLRNTESLKHEKGSGMKHLMPLGCRIGYTPHKEDTTNSTLSTGAGALEHLTDEKEKVYSQASTEACKYALADLLPLYIVSRIYSMQETVRKMLPACKTTTRHGITWPVLDITNDFIADLMTCNPDMISNASAYGSFDRATLEKEGIGTAIADLVLAVGETAVSMRYFSKTGDLAGKTKRSYELISSGKSTRTRESLNVIRDSKLHTALLVSSGSAALSMMLHNNEGFKRQNSDKGNPLTFNIIPMMYSLVFDMIKEYLEAMYHNKEDDFFNRIADKAILFFDNSYQASTAAGTHGAEMLFASPKKDDDGKPIDGKYYYYNGFEIMQYVKTPTQSDGVIDFFGIELAKLTSGVESINGFIADDMKNIEKYQNVQNGSSANVMGYSGAINVMHMVNSAVKRISHMLEKKNMNYWTITNIRDFAQHLQSKTASRVFAADVIRSLVVVSTVDVQAYNILKAIGQKGGIPDTLTMDQIDGIIQQETINSVSLITPGQKFIDDLKMNNAPLINDLITAGIYIEDDNLDVAEFSGMFVDGMFGDGYSSAVKRGMLRMMQLQITGMAMMLYDTPEVLKKKLGYTPECTFHSILSEVNSSQWGRCWMYAKKYAAQLASFGLVLVVAILPALIPLAAVLKIIVGIVCAFLAIKQLILWLLDNAIKYTLSMGQLFKIGEWMIAHISQSVTIASAAQLCLSADIWLYSILDCNDDARATETTSYMDYPIIRCDGEPMMPDFYMHKVGMLMEQYKQTKGLMTDMIQDVSATNAGATAEDFNVMLEEFNEQVKAFPETITASFGIEIGNIIASAVERVRHPNRDALYQLLKKTHICLNNVWPTSSSIINIKTGKALPADPYDKIGIVVVFDPEKRIGMVHVNDIIETLIQSDDFKDSIGSASFVKDIEDGVDGQSVPIAQSLFGTGISSEDGVAFMEDVCVRIAYKIINLAQNYIIAGNQLIPVEVGIPGTLSNMTFIKNLIGNSIKSVGKEGITYFKEMINSIGNQELRKSAGFRSNYLYPTIKVFFIEEDSEAYYLFDDLYSYASIVSVESYENDTDPMQTATMQVTNLNHVLDNMVADMAVKEGHFLMGSEEQSSYFVTGPENQSMPMNAIMLKPGCKVKIQAGSSPILTEENTIFAGEITDIAFDDITSIQLQGYGAVFHTEISKGVTRVFKGMNTVEAEQSVLTKITRPTSRISSVVGDVLSTITTETRLSDYTANPDMALITDGDISSASLNYDSVVKDTLVTGLSEAMYKQTGVNLRLYQNRQLFENVHINSTDLDSTYGTWIPSFVGIRSIPRIGNLFDSLFGMPQWISYDESAWDVLQEINMLLPNYRMYVRPFDTRGTLVWGEDDRYYRFKRTIDPKSISSSLLLEHIQDLKGSNDRVSISLLRKISSIMQGGNEDQIASVMALHTTITYYAQLMYDTMCHGRKLKKMEMITTPTPDGQKISDNYEMKDIVAAQMWMGHPMNDPVKAGEALRKTANMISSIEEELTEKIEEYNKDKKAKGEIDLDEVLKDAFDLGMLSDLGRIAGAGLTLFSSIMSEMSGNVTAFDKMFKKKEIMTFGYKYLFWHYAAEQVVDYVLQIVQARSLSHRKISDIHIKMSGRDIIRNDIQLSKPYNVVDLGFPERSADSDPTDVLSPGGEEHREIMVHYKLSPRDHNRYSSFYKNANIMPHARSSVISTVASSLLANTMTEMYTGSITLIGDPSIRAGDRVLVYDENRDMYGMVRVKSHVFRFNSKDGCISVIEPGMIVKSKGKIQDSLWDTFSTLSDIAMGALVIGVTARGAYKAGSGIVNKLRWRARLDKSAGEMITGFDKRYTSFQKWFPGINSSHGWVSGASRTTRQWIRKTGDLLNRERKMLDVFDTVVKDSGPTKQMQTMIAGFIDDMVDLSVSYGRRSAAGAAKLKNLPFTIEKSVNITLYRNMMNTLGKNADDIPASKILELNDELTNMLRLSVRKIVDASSLRNTGAVDDLVMKVYRDVVGNMYTSYRKNLRIDDAVLSNGEFDDLFAGIFLKKGTSIGSHDDMITALGKLKIDDLNEYTRVYADNMGRIFTKKGKELKEMQASIKQMKGAKDFHDDEIAAMTDAAFNTLAFNNTALWKIAIGSFKTPLKVFIGAEMVDSLFIGPAHSLSELALVASATADTTTISPMWYRGEPFVAGLGGIDKWDARKAGLNDITKARFAAMFEGFKYTFDGFRQGVFEIQVELAKKRRITE